MAWEPFEENARNWGFQVLAGLDEAGRGPLAGPVVAAAVVFPVIRDVRGVRDSKLLSADQREKAFPLIEKRARAVGVGVIDAAEIDRLNILRASLRAMEVAINNLPVTPDFLLIDGRDCLNFSGEQQAIPKGDRRCLSIAAASIVAKVTRDRLMMAYDKDYPEYNFARHKGYATREHLDAIRKYGCCPIHRQSFHNIYQFQLL